MDSQLEERVEFTHEERMVLIGALAEFVGQREPLDRYISERYSYCNEADQKKHFERVYKRVQLAKAMRENFFRVNAICLARR